MNAPNGIERRDPFSGLLKLGGTLARVGRLGLSGDVRVAHGPRIYVLRLIRGIVSEIIWQGQRDPMHPQTVQDRASALFEVARPLVSFDDTAPLTGRLTSIHSEQVVLAGVLRRKDLFDPKPLVARIPVETLRVKDLGPAGWRTLGLSNDEIHFVRQLCRPTPATLALWKRGLAPKHAAALVMALNLLNLFENWPAGDLPRNQTGAKARRRIASGASDHTLLGLDTNANEQQIDRAFRKLSYELHPDRVGALPAEERAAAEQSFKQLSLAHTRLKQHSRRAKPVRHHTPAPLRKTEPWQTAYDTSKAAAAKGDRFTARAFALKALAASPPPHIVQHLKTLIRQVA